MRSITTTAVITAAASFVAAVPAARAEQIYGILNNNPGVGEQLVTINSATRAVTNTVLLQTPDTLTPIGSIDVRPATGELYGLGANNDQLYRINPATGAITAIGAPLPTGGLIDFNPVNDSLRVISGTTNYSVNPADGTLFGTDTPLSFVPGDANAGNTPNVFGIAHANNNDGVSSTTLYDLVEGTNAGGTNDTLAVQFPRPAGTLTTVGPLGVDANAGPFGPATGFVGFDISGATGTAYLTSGQFAGPSTLYTVDLSTGAATSLGTITGLPDGRTVAEIAVAVPEPTTVAVLATGAAGLLLGRRAKGRSRRAAK